MAARQSFALDPDQLDELRENFKSVSPFVCSFHRNHYILPLIGLKSHDFCTGLVAAIFRLVTILGRALVNMTLMSKIKLICRLNRMY